MSKFPKTLLIPLLLLLHGYCLAQSGDVIYMRADYDEPWCCGWAPYEFSNPLNLTEVFGPGGWSLHYYEYTDANAIFNDNTCYVFMEGGDGHADMMEWFFSCNQTLIENWVYNGGSLFINAAPNVGDGLSFGFGDVWLWYPYAFPTDVSQDPAGASHMIWSGPFLPTTTNMFGPAYAHAYVSGSGLTPIITETYNQDQLVLAEKNWGLGHVFFGGMTTACWHWPETESVNIRQNMHSYMYVVCGLLLSEQALSFKAQTFAGGALLNWGLENSDSGSYFELLRSKNGTDWELISVISVSGSLDYEMIDTDPLQGKSYYQLKLKDELGRTLQEKMAPVEIDMAFDVFPNPAKNNLVVSGIDAQAAAYQLFSIEGNEVAITSTSGFDEVLLTFSGLTKGSYTLLITANGQRLYKSIIII